MREKHCNFTNRLKKFLRKQPRFYVFLVRVISPMCFMGISPKKFLERFSNDALIYNLGAGVHRYPNVKNVDIEKFDGVDIVADATNLPFADESADGVICEMLIEHVPNAQKVVDEILRILKSGGSAYVTAPFVYPFHACPHDYNRWSSSGLKELCKNGKIESVGVRAGPTSALMAQLITWIAIVLSLGNQRLYDIWSNLFMLVFFPLKFLDLIIGHFPTALHGPGACFVIFRKCK